MDKGSRHRIGRTRPAEIRRAGVPDAAAIAQIHVDAWRAAYEGLLPQDFLEALSVERREAVWVHLLESGSGGSPLTLVLTESTTPTGFATVSESRDADADEGIGELQVIYLTPPRWGTGLGRALLERAMAELAGMRMDGATLWVLEGNARARAFYERNGWDVDGRTRTEEPGGLFVNEVRYRIRL